MQQITALAGTFRMQIPSPRRPRARAGLGGLQARVAQGLELVAEAVVDQLSPRSSKWKPFSRVATQDLMQGLLLVDDDLGACSRSSGSAPAGAFAVDIRIPLVDGMLPHYWKKASVGRDTRDPSSVYPVAFNNVSAIIEGPKIFRSEPL